MRRLIAGTVTVLLMVSASCTSVGTTPSPATSALIVRNESPFDVNVYVIPSEGSTPRRMGTVWGESSGTFPIRRGNLQIGDRLVVQLHAVGSNSNWTSDAVDVADGTAAVVEVRTDPTGDCSRSTIRTLIGAQVSRE